MRDQNDAERRMAFFQQLARETAAAGPQDECGNPDCAGAQAERGSGATSEPCWAASRALTWRK
jgi:hypothetical protein